MEFFRSFLLVPPDCLRGCSTFQRTTAREPVDDIVPREACTQRIGSQEKRDRRRAMLSFPERRGRAGVTGRGVTALSQRYAEWSTAATPRAVKSTTPSRERIFW